MNKLNNKKGKKAYFVEVMLFSNKEVL